MSCINIYDNDSTLDPPSYAGGSNRVCAIRSGTSESGVTSTQRIQFQPDGTWNIQNNPAVGPVVRSGTWISGAFNPNDYEIRFVAAESWSLTCSNAGGCSWPPTSGVNNIDSGWLSLDVARAFNTSGTAPGPASCECIYETDLTFTIDIRKKTAHADSVSAAGTLCASAHNLA